jgi:hypothetical protein
MTWYNKITSCQIRMRTLKLRNLRADAHYILKPQFIKSYLRVDQLKMLEVASLQRYL